MVATGGPAAAAAQQRGAASAGQQQQQQQRGDAPKRPRKRKPSAAAATAAAAAASAAAGGGGGGGAAGGAARGAAAASPVDKGPTEQPVHLIPESALFNSLVMQEHELDALIRRRRAQVQAAASPFDAPVHKRLRIYLYNTHAHQPAAGAAGAAAAGAAAAGAAGGSAAAEEPPQWALYVWGRLVDADEPPAPADGAAGPAPHPKEPQQQQQQQQQQQLAGRHPLTSFFRSIRVQLDPAQFPGAQGTLLWERFHHKGPHRDRLEVRRAGQWPVPVRVTFELEGAPPTYLLAPPLAELLGAPIGQQANVQARLWELATRAGGPPEGGVLRLGGDARLSAVFGGADALPVAGLPAAVAGLLAPLPPVTVNYTVQVAGPSPSAVTCVDVDVLLPARPADRLLLPAVDALFDERLRAVAAAEHKLQAQLQRLHEARRRRALYLGFSEAPVQVLNTLVAANAREMRAARGAAGAAAAAAAAAAAGAGAGAGAGAFGAGVKEVELERRTDVFADRWVDEAAARWLSKRANDGGC